MLLTPTLVNKVIKKETEPLERTAKKELSRLLEDANLTAPEVLDNLSSMMRAGESDGVRLRAAETALKLNGLLDSDTEKNQFQVNIIIKDSTFGDVNPIVIPR